MADRVNSTISGTQPGIVVQAAAAQSLAVIGFPASVTAGAANSFTVTAFDPYGNVATGYVGTVQFTSSDSQAGLPANYTFVTTDRGSHTFSATLKTAGTQYLKVTDTVTSTITGTQSGIVVQPAGPSRWPSRASPPRSRLRARNIIHGHRVMIRTATSPPATLARSRFTSTDSGAALPANYPFTSGNAGTHSFTATLETAGPRRFATDTVTSSIKGTRHHHRERRRATASLVKRNTTTQGNWQTAYGNQGYDIVSDATNIPSYATVTLPETTYTWTTTSSDSRALATPGSGNRVAAAWYSTTSFTIGVNLTDGQAHDIALYALDWDNARTQRADPDLERLDRCDPGYRDHLQFLERGLSSSGTSPGNVNITVTSLAGTNAVINGLFFDPARAGDRRARFLDQRHHPRQLGKRLRHHGLRPRQRARSASPHFANVNAGRRHARPGRALRPIVRALETPGSSNRVAAVWVAPATSFTIAVNLTDGQAHDIALYLP